MKNPTQILFNLSEIGAGTRGASLGPEAIRAAARKRNSLFFNVHQPKTLVHRNELLDKPSSFQFAKYINGMKFVFDETASEVLRIFQNNQKPILISGDHGSAGGTIKGIQQAYPESRIGVIWIDAHADLHTPYTTPSGNMHGMPLATAIGTDNLEEKSNEVDEETQLLWNELKTGAIQPENLVFIGVRDTEPQEDALMERLNIKNYRVAEVREKGWNHVREEIREKLKNCDILYISFDVDSMDPELSSYGTGTPVADGFEPKEARKMLTDLVKFKQFKCLEFVEINPCLDNKCNAMAEIAFELLEAVMLELQ